MHDYKVLKPLGGVRSTGVEKGRVGTAFQSAVEARDN
jgi:hypothetical protein